LLLLQVKSLAIRRADEGGAGDNLGDVVLHSQRKRRADRDAQEAGGADLWQEEVPRRARVKIAGIWRLIEGESVSSYAFGQGISQILQIQGGYNISSMHPDTFVGIDDADMVLDIIGAACQYISNAPSAAPHSETFESFVNDVLEDYRVAFRVVDHEVIPVGSDELHVEVVVPALRLLVGDRFSKGHAAYLEAIKEIPANPGNAITDAGTALQEVLVALGCEGNALGPLIKSAKKKGLLAAHDATLERGVENFLSWASADRSETGDGHHVTDASRADAWLMVHVIGALIVRLVDPSKRARG